MNNFLEAHPTDTDIFRAIILFGANGQKERVHRYLDEMAAHRSDVIERFQKRFNES